MKMMKKIGALLLALVMVLATATAFGDVSLTGGEVGGYITADTQNVDSKIVKIKKEITAFNPETTLIYGPDFTYTYTVTPGSANVDITDDATTDHASGLATSTKTLVGITTGVKVNSGSAGGNDKATGTLVWSNSDILDATATGTANVKTFTIDFTDVVFSQPGVYRYKITETPAATDGSYAAAGITETDGSRVRYLDVYVMRSDKYGKTSDGNGVSNENAKHWWKIYGYVCTYHEEEITTADTTAVGAVKTDGFVAGTGNNGATTKPVTADQYHTYNLTVGKTLNNDATMNGHPFPFDVAFANGTAGTATGNFQFAVETTAASGGSSPTITSTTDTATTATVNGNTISTSLIKVGDADVVTKTGKDGNPEIPNGATVKYIGIPNTIKVTVTETNNVIGTTYTTTATETVGNGTAAAVAFDPTLSENAALSTDKKTATNDQGDKVAYAQSAAPTADSNVVIQYTNALAIISPTGYVARIAPYALMLAAGIVLLVIFMKRRKPATEDEE